MKFIPPSRLTFWRSVFALTGVLPFLALYQILGSAAKVGVDLSISQPWQGLVAGLALMGLLSLFLLALTFSRYRERVLSLVEFPDTTNVGPWTGIIPVAVGLAGFTVLFMIPAIQSSVGGLGWMRFLIFWSFSLIGMWGIKLLREETSWWIALIAMVLCQSTLHLLLVYWPRVTEYPFAMGWSETSRFYFP